MDTILNEPHPDLALIKENYPHYFHYRGRNNECCYYEKAPKMNLKVLKSAGIQLDDLLRHYALVSNATHQYISLNCLHQFLSAVILKEYIPIAQYIHRFFYKSNSFSHFHFLPPHQIPL